MCFQQLCKPFLSGCHQKFLKRERIKFQKIYLAHRERRPLVKCDSQQRTGTDNVVLGRIFNEENKKCNEKMKFRYTFYNE